MSAYRQLIRTAEIGVPLTFRVRLEFDQEPVRASQMRNIFLEIRRVNRITERTATIDDHAMRAIQPNCCMFSALQPWETDAKGYNVSYTIPPNELPETPGLYLFVFTFYGNALTRCVNYLLEF